MLKLFSALAALFISTQSFAANYEKISLQNDPHFKAVGRIYSAEGTMRWCSGTLISSRLVLTAAHCIAEISNEVNHNLSQTDVRFYLSGSNTPHKAIRTFHSKHSAPFVIFWKMQLSIEKQDVYQSHDIALLLLEKEIKDVEPLKVRWNSLSELELTNNLRVAPMGYPKSESLKYPAFASEVPLFRVKNCNLGGAYNPYMLFALCRVEERFSGGPLVHFTDNGAEIIGVISSTGTDRSTHIAVAAHESWMREVIRLTSPK